MAVAGVVDLQEVGGETGQRWVVSAHTAPGGVEVEDRLDQGSLAWDHRDVRPRSPDAKHQPLPATPRSGP